MISMRLESVYSDVWNRTLYNLPLHLVQREALQLARSFWREKQRKSLGHVTNLDTTDVARCVASLSDGCFLELRGVL
jgi:hypothetical protein